MSILVNIDSACVDLLLLDQTHSIHMDNNLLVWILLVQDDLDNTELKNQARLFQIQTAQDKCPRSVRKIFSNLTAKHLSKL